MTAMMTLPGAPCIYYGDEIGLSAAGDPYCRGAFPWDDRDSWNQDLLSHYKRVISIRNKYPVFRTGTFKTLYAEDMIYAHHRKLEDQEALVVFNAGEEPAEVQIPLPGDTWDGQSSARWQIDAGVLKGRVSGRDTMILVSTT
jgi:neopullulanase